MTKIKWTLALITLFACMGLGKTVQAEGMGYSVKAIIPDNQLETGKTYFDLLVKPGETQQLTLEVTSSSKETLNLSITPYSATTNQNGELEFSVEPSVHDATLTYPMSQLISGSQSVTLPPMATKEVTFTLKVPKDPFLGKLVGGFTIYDLANDQEVKTSGKNEVQIRNVFSVVVGIRLQETLKKIQPKLVLNRVKADLFNYRTAMTANLQNTQPTFISNLNVTAKIKKAGSRKVLYEGEKTEMTMAPNSNFDFPIMLENQQVGPGKYVLELVAKSGDYQWSFSKKFTVSKAEADKLNDQALELVDKANPWLFILTLFLVISVIVVISVMATISKSKWR